MKITLVSWAPFLGGAEVAAERLALGLHQAGHQVLVVLGTRGTVLDRMQQTGLRVIYSPIVFTDKWRPWRFWLARRALRKILLQEQPDIVHSNDLPTHQIVASALRGTRIPEVCHHRWIFDGPAIDWLNKWPAPHHVFVSQALMDQLCEASSALRQASRSVLYDGLPLPPLPTAETRQAARAKLDLPSERVLVTFAGQIIERKGVADLIRAWMLIDETVRQRADLLIIGDDLASGGEYRRIMEELAQELVCPARFLGFQKNVAEWLLASDVALVPSHAEPLGNATLEAMSFALPVLGCHVGGIPEMVVNEQTGLLVPPRSPVELSQALARLIADSALRKRLGTAARERCEKLFSLEAHVQATVTEYMRVTLNHAHQQ